MSRPSLLWAMGPSWCRNRIVGGFSTVDIKVRRHRKIASHPLLYYGQRATYSRTEISYGRNRFLGWGRNRPVSFLSNLLGCIGDGQSRWRRISRYRRSEKSFLRCAGRIKGEKKEGDICNQDGRRRARDGHRTWGSAVIERNENDFGGMAD